jgi:hypothetical protein
MVNIASQPSAEHCRKTQRTGTLMLLRASSPTNKRGTKQYRAKRSLAATPLRMDEIADSRLGIERHQRRRCEQAREKQACGCYHDTGHPWSALRLKTCQPTRSPTQRRLKPSVRRSCCVLHHIPPPRKTESTRGAHVLAGISLPVLSASNNLSVDAILHTSRMACVTVAVGSGPEWLKMQRLSLW